MPCASASVYIAFPEIIASYLYCIPKRQRLSLHFYIILHKLLASHSTHKLQLQQMIANLLTNTFSFPQKIAKHQVGLSLLHFLLLLS